MALISIGSGIGFAEVSIDAKSVTPSSPSMQYALTAANGFVAGLTSGTIYKSLSDMSGLTGTVFIDPSDFGGGSLTILVNGLNPTVISEFVPITLASFPVNTVTFTATIANTTVGVNFNAAFSGTRFLL